MLFMSSLLPFCIPSPPSPSSSPSITPLHSKYKTLSQCNFVTFLWHDLWTCSLQLASCSCFYARWEDRACFDGYMMETWKTLLVGENSAGNYVDKIRTRDEFDVLRRKWENGKNEESFTACVFDLWKVCKCHVNFFPWPKSLTRKMR